MKLTDYKFWYITRDDNGFITEIAVRFYEGDITTDLEHDAISNTMKPVIRYRRTKRLKKNDLGHLVRKFRKEKNGNDVRIYHKSEFGTIKTDDELRLFLDDELFKDKSRIPIIEQRRNV